MGTLGVFKNKGPTKHPEDGVVYLSSDGQSFKAPKIDVDLISQYRENLFMSDGLDKQQRILFQDDLVLKVIDKKTLEADNDLTEQLTAMCLEVDLDFKVQQIWRDVMEWGPGIINPVWDYEENEYRLLKLNRLEPWSFSSKGASYKSVSNRILPGIAYNQDTKEIEFWQKQTLGGVTRLQNVFLFTDPLKTEVGGTPFIIPIVPLVTMLGFSFSAQMQKVNRYGAGGLWFIKVTNAKGDDKAYAQKILRNAGKNTAYPLRENMEIINLGIGENGSALETITELGMLIRSFFTPSSLVSKDGTLIGGSNEAEYQLYMSYIKGTHRWIERRVAKLLDPWLTANLYDGYKLVIDIPEPTVDKSEFKLKALDSAEKNKRILTNESRRVYNELGLELPELDEAGLAELAAQNEASAGPAPMLQKLDTVARLVSANDLDPTHLISEEDARAVVNQALGIKKKFCQGGQGSGNFGHAGRPGERGGSGAGASAAINNWASNNGSSKVEHSSIFNENGDEIFSNTGKEKSVKVKKDQVKDGHVVHNHPSGCAGFSTADVYSAIVGDAASMSVVVPDGTVVTIERPDEGWPNISKDELSRIHADTKLEVSKERSSVYYKIRALFKRGASKTEAKNQYLKDVSKRVLNKIGLEQKERKSHG